MLTENTITRVQIETLRIEAHPTALREAAL
jgi:hypothetical protein